MTTEVQMTEAEAEAYAVKLSAKEADLLVKMDTKPS